MADETEVILTLKISIDTPEDVPAVWRELVIRGGASLSELSAAIQTCFGWAGIHKHEFVAPDSNWKATDPQYGPPEFDDSYKDEEEVLLQDVASKTGSVLVYNYDLTDPWAHFVEVISIETGNVTSHKTKLVGGARAGIPEDCGGASGFGEFLDSLDPKHPEHTAMAAWYKAECPNGAPKYDPEAIDFDKINKRLASWSPP